jgi:cysteine synthase
VKSLGLEQTLVDAEVYQHSLKRFAEERIALPTFAQLADPSTIPPSVELPWPGLTASVPTL